MKRPLYIIVLLVSLFSACKKNSPLPKPVTCASVNADSAVVGQYLTFISCTKGASTYLWNFGDSTTAKADTISHTYNLPGTYLVTLTTSNASGTGTTQTLTILVTAPNYWTFMGVNYYAGYITQGLNGDDAADNYSIGFGATSSIYNSNSASQIGVAFSGCSPSSISLNDTIKSGFLPFNGGAAINISVPNTSLGYNSIYSNQTASIKVAPNGKISITGNNIKVVSIPPLIDTETVSFHLTQ